MAYDPSTQSVAEAAAKIKAVQATKSSATPAKSSTPTSTSGGYVLTNPTGGTTNITAEQAASYNQGANKLAPGFTVTKVNVPSNVSSKAVDSNLTTDDVMDRRSELAGQKSASDSFSSYLQTQGTDKTTADMLAGFWFPQETEAVTNARGAEQDLISDASKYLKGLFGIDSVQKYNDRLDEAGVPDIQKQIAESNMRLARLRGEQMKIRPQIESEAGQTRVGAEARLNPVERMLNAEIGAEALVQAALVGNLEAVTGNIDKIMQLEFADQERNLQIFDQRIKLEQARIDSLTGADKQYAEARLAAAQLMMDNQQQALQDKKDAKQQLLDFAADYVKATGDGAGALEIAKGKLTYEQALAKYGPSMKSGSTSDLIKSGAATFTKSQVQSVALALEASRGTNLNDEYWNTDIYMQELAAWKAAGGDEKDFVEQFGVNSLNPNDVYQRTEADGTEKIPIPKWFADEYMMEDDKNKICFTNPTTGVKTCV